MILHKITKLLRQHWLDSAQQCNANRRHNIQVQHQYC